MSNIPGFFLAISAFVLLPLYSTGQILEKRTGAKIDSIVNSYMINNQMIGVSIGIVKNGKVYLTKGYGTAEIDKPKPIDSLTNFLTCSITKLFTATAIMQLSEQGKIDIKKKLIFYLPDFKMKDERYKDITIEHLMTHTSGLSWDVNLKNSPNDSSAIRKLVYSLANKKLAFAPGTRFNPTATYSNAAYDILGYLVQLISGKPYEEYIKDNILEIAIMPNSSIDYYKTQVERRSTPHILKRKVVKTGGIYTENAEHNPSGNWTEYPANSFQPFIDVAVIGLYCCFTCPIAP